MEEGLKEKKGKNGELSDEKERALKNRLILVTSKLIIIIIVIALAILSQR
jgi:cytoskeletal protein RodZ